MLHNNDNSISTEAIFNSYRLLGLNRMVLNELKEKSNHSLRRRYRLCLHHSTESTIQEMIISLSRGAYCVPHCHPESPASHHIIEGEMDVYIFDNNGNISKVYRMGTFSSDNTFCLWLEPGCWHMTVPTSDNVIFHEVIAGPFVQERSNRIPYWAPNEIDEVAVESFFNKLYQERIHNEYNLLK